ncbi:SH3 domain-containing YSC84-like protein 1 isoform X3 [Lepidochelys kempii]|uniref:SH3 domain-containing YSC84-like protein 1 isoform X3 n=1 Tax=Lepidochelys kempii TaxID=8472 RepID=UPI003C6F902B
MNNPIPSTLKSEAKKAAKILREFTEITSRNGPDKIIPANVIAKAKGLAVLSVIKAGFLVTARGGSGIVLARLPNGSWSSPSAIGIAGLGGGFEIGIEVSDLVVILNHERAVEAFAKGGNLTLGGNFTVAIGPLGRFYGQDIRASAILFGDVPRLTQSEDLHEILDSFTEQYENEEQKNRKRKAGREQRKANDPPVKPSSRPQSRKPPVYAATAAVKNPHKLYPELPNYHPTEGNSETKRMEVTALYSFEGQQPGDLNFKAGDKIIVKTKTNSQFDWWEGSIRGQTGIFPANYVTTNCN